MSCPSCLRRVASLFIGSASRLLPILRSTPRSNFRPSLQQIYPRTFSARAQFRSQDPFQLPDTSHFDGAANGSAEASPAARQDPEPTDLIKELGLQLDDAVTDGVAGKKKKKKPRWTQEMREERANREKASSGNVRLPSTATEDVSRRTASLFSNEGARGWKNPKGGSKETKWGPRKPYKDREHWQIDKEALKRKFGETGWQPLKRLSPDAMEGIRALNKSDPGTFTTAVLAERFQVSPEAIRRILKSRWRPTEEEQDERTERWRKRGERIWSKLAETGVRPPKQWREMGVGRVEGGRGVVPPWKKKSRGARRQGASEAVPFSEEEFADYGSEDEDWGDRIL